MSGEGDNSVTTDIPAHRFDHPGCRWRRFRSAMAKLTAGEVLSRPRDRNSKCLIRLSQTSECQSPHKNPHYCANLCCVLSAYVV